MKVGSLLLLLHATYFAEFTHCIASIEKYSSLGWHITLLLAHFYCVFFFILCFRSAARIFFFLVTFNHFGQLIITAMGMSKIFKSIHSTVFFFLFAPQSGHVFCLVLFFLSLCIFGYRCFTFIFRISILCVLLLCLTSEKNHPKIYDQKRA